MRHILWLISSVLVVGCGAPAQKSSQVQSGIQNVSFYAGIQNECEVSNYGTEAVNVTSVTLSYTCDGQYKTATDYTFQMVYPGSTSYIQVPIEAGCKSVMASSCTGMYN